MHRTSLAVFACTLTLGGCASLDPVPPTLDFGEAFVGVGRRPNPSSGRTTTAASSMTWPMCRSTVAPSCSCPSRRPSPSRRAPLRPRSGSVSFRRQKARTRTGPFPTSGLGIPGIDARLRGVGVKPVLPEGGYLGAIGPLDPITGTASSMDFGDIGTGTSAYRTLTLRNTGSTERPLDITFSTGSAYAAASSATVSSTIRQVAVPANSSLTIVLVFTPPVAGTFRDDVQFAARVRAASRTSGCICSARRIPASSYLRALYLMRCGLARPPRRGASSCRPRIPGSCR